jgi:hypothetical protein
MIFKNDLAVVQYLVEGHGLDPNHANDVSFTFFVLLSSPSLIFSFFGNIVWIYSVNERKFQWDA